VAEPLYHDPRLAQLYDAACPWSEDREFCLKLARGCQSVLDLGCGTGSLASAIAETCGSEVVGVDPAQAMLDQARIHSGHDRVRWICADARSFRLGQAFDLIVMTGHAFQCLLSDADRLQVLGTIAAHLAPHGRFIFDSRNPLAEEWLEWKPQTSAQTFSHPQLGDVEAWNDAHFDASTQIVTYETYYRLCASREVLHAPASRIAFPSKQQLDRLIQDSGLGIERWLGDWWGGALQEHSPELIPIGGLAH
jgi:SAM-dependent methyltransferase